MIQELTFFNTEEDLVKLTGLTPEQLWDTGADLDDWDYGFCCRKPLHREIREENKYPDRWDTPDKDGKYYYTRYEYDRDTPTYWLMQNAELYCCGWKHFEYNGMHYYTVHHA